MAHQPAGQERAISISCLQSEVVEGGIMGYGSTGELRPLGRRRAMRQQWFFENL